MAQASSSLGRGKANLQAEEWLNISAAAATEEREGAETRRCRSRKKTVVDAGKENNAT